MRPHIRSEFRLFISSTFQDLQRERNHLLKHVFPRIRAACRERGIEFTEIDLRWGVTEEESSQGRVIRSCLEEIENCRPYFLGILGNRYGWVPQLADVQKDYQLIQKHPWIEDAALGQASLMEIEFMFGFLNDPEVSESARVYAKEPQSEDPNERRHLLALRAKIEAHGEPVRSFETPDELGDAIMHDLMEMIERDWPADEQLSPLEIERMRQEAFAATRRKAYIANSQYYKRLIEFTESEEQPLIVHGASGMGKSALVAYFAEHYQRTHPDAFVVCHFVGASPSGGEAISILRHILNEIQARTGIVESIPDGMQQLVEALPRWLAYIQDERMLLVIDALNQLPEQDGLMTWLPEFIPASIRVIVTTTPGPTLASLQSRNWPELVLRSLGIAERAALIVRFLGEYHKGLDKSQLEGITNDPKSASPLFLRTLLEELRICGEHQLLGATIEHYMGARDINELFQLVLERMESDYGRELVASVMAFIAASRQGLSEPELIEITRCERSQLSMLLLALDYHLMKPNGYFTFFHDYLCEAVNRRYLSNPSIARNAHRELAKHFETRDIGPRRLDEEPWQWIRAGDKPGLWRCLKNADILIAFSDAERSYELLQHWSASGAALESCYNHLLGGTLDSLENYKLHLTVARFYFLAGQFAAARPILENLVADAIEVESIEELKIKAFATLGDVLTELGDHDAARTLLQTVLRMSEELYGVENPVLIDALVSLATLKYGLKELDSSEEYFHRALKLCDTAYGLSHPKHVSIQSNLAAVYYEKGDYAKALAAFEAALSVSRSIHGLKHPETAQLLNNMGAVLINLHKPESAIGYFKQAVEINKTALGPQHPQTLSNQVNFAKAAQDLGDFTIAIATMKTVIPSIANIYGEQNAKTLLLKNNFALMLAESGDHSGAEAMIKEVLAGRIALYGEDNLEVTQTYLNLARIYMLAGRLIESKSIFEAYLPGHLELQGHHHPASQFVLGQYKQLLGKLESENATFQQQ